MTSWNKKRLVDQDGKCDDSTHRKSPRMPLLDPPADRDVDQCRIDENATCCEERDQPEIVGLAMLKSHGDHGGRVEDTSDGRGKAQRDSSPRQRRTGTK